MSSKWFLVLLCAVSFTALSWSQDLERWTDSYVLGLVPPKHFRGSIVAERNGQVLVEKSYGEAVEEWQVPNSAETKFEIASLSKQFTATAILQLADAGKLKVGDPLDESSDLGPLIRESDAIRAADWVQEAVRGGARLLCGGNRKGSLFEPTVLTGTKPNMKVNCQEIFAPVVTVEPYNDFVSALKQLNNSAYGLQAGLFTRDAKLIFQAYDELEVGGLIAGDVPTFRIDHMPYGGVKDSGLGREGLRDAIQEMTEPKLLVMNLR